MPGPLEGVRIFDLTLFMVGPWAAMQLGAMGADVIHVEEPGSVHGSRIWVPPSMKGTSVGYIVWNLNKRGMLLDLKQEQDREIAHRLIESCDLFLENMRPGTVERLGMGYETLSAINPRLVYVSSSGFGRRGPMAGMPANDTVVQCVSGLASVTGRAGNPYELYRHHTQIDATTGNLMVQAALLGLRAQDATGRGQRIDVPMLGAATALQTTRAAEYFATGEDPSRLGSAASTTAPHEAFLCQDGQYVAAGVVEERQWAPFCGVLGKPELVDDPRFQHNSDRVRQRDELSALLAPVFLTKPCYHWVMRLSERGVPCGRFHHWDELRYHEQIAANGHVLEVDTPWGRVYAGGPPWKFSETPAKMSASPEPGEHMAEILEHLEARLPLSIPDGEGAGGVRPPMPVLEGLLVVECAQGIAGPYAAMALGDAGADVVKVESPGGDATRGWGPPFDRGESAVFLSLNRNKRGIVIDTERPEGRQALRRLLSQADVFIEDWGAGVADRRGFGYEELTRENPRLVHCSLTAFGEKGPLRERAGSELVVQAMGEATASLGTIGGAPVRLGADLASMSAGIFAVQGVLAALFRRDRTGRGQRVDTSLLGATMFMRSTLWASHSDPDEWQGFHLDSYVKPPDHAYHAGDGQFYLMFPRGLTPEQWRDFLSETGMDKYLDDPRFASYRDALGLGRYGHQVQELWNGRFRERPFEALRELIERFGGSAWRLNSYSSLFAHPQAEVLGLSMDVPHASGGSFRATGFPWEMHGTPAAVRRPPPLLGQHTIEMLREMGYAEDEVVRLLEQAVVRRHEGVGVE